MILFVNNVNIYIYIQNSGNFTLKLKYININRLDCMIIALSMHFSFVHQCNSCVKIYNVRLN